MERFIKALAVEIISLASVAWLELLAPGVNPVGLEVVVFLTVWLSTGSHTVKGFLVEAVMSLLGVLLPGVALLGELHRKD